MKTSQAFLSKIRELHRLYIIEIDQSNLSHLSAKVYKINSENFIRWIEGTFQPGVRVHKLKKAK